METPVEPEYAEYARLHAVVARVRFRDWRFKVGMTNGRHWLQIEFDAPDLTKSVILPGDAEVQRGRKWFLSRHMTDSEVVQTALVAVLAASEHEVREDFRYRSEAIFGPHFDVEALYSMCRVGQHDVRESVTA